MLEKMVVKQVHWAEKPALMLVGKVQKKGLMAVLYRLAMMCQKVQKKGWQVLKLAVVRYLKVRW